MNSFNQALKKKKVDNETTAQRGGFLAKKEKIGADYDGTADNLYIEGNSVIITGRPKEDEPILRERIGNLPIYFFKESGDDPVYEKDTPELHKEIAKFKAKTIKELGLTKFYEDSPDIIDILKMELPDVEIVEVPIEGTYEAKPDVLNIIFFSSDGIGFPVAEKLVNEGNNVIVAYVQDLEDIDGDDEEPEVKRRRLSLYDGILDKQDSRIVLNRMERIKNKEEWIVWFDFNALAPIAENVLDMGFTKGLFPTLDDLELEKDRDLAKEIVKENYKDLNVAEVHDFKKADDGVQFLNETEGLWVLKGNGDSAKTIVPWNNDPELAKQILIDALEAHASDYEDGGFILEEKIVDGYELTPQIVFLDGKVVFTDIDIENKPVCAGNCSVQTGAMQTLVVKTKLSDKINKIAFPKWIYERAKEHTGLFVFDAGLICKDDRYYFTEFCSQRFGYDSWFVELTMAGSCTDFFRNLFDGKNPLKDNFGIATRGMNLHKDDKERRVLEGVSIVSNAPENTWIFECKKENGRTVCTGGGWDLVVFTGSADSLNKASKIAHETSEQFAFEDLYMRPEFDLLSFDYTSSIPNRFSNLNHKMFEAKDMEDYDKFKSKEKMKDLENRLNTALNEQD